MKKLLSAVAGIGLFVSTASAQLTTGAWGISPGLTFYPGGTTRPLEVGYAVLDNLRIYGDLALSTFSGSGTSTTGIDFTVGADYYLWHVESIATFIGGNLGIGSVSGTGGSTSFLLNPEFGADYFLSPHFSINGTLGFGLSAGTITTFTTQTGLHATWWLK
jgi:hypothetical protein